MDDLYRSKGRRTHRRGPGTKHPSTDVRTRGRNVHPGNWGKKKLSGGKKALLTLLIILVILALAVGGMYAYYKITGDKNAMIPFLQMYLSCAADNVDYQPGGTPTPTPSITPSELPDDADDTDILPGETYVPTDVAPVTNKDTQVTNILLMGMDRWGGASTGRSDTNIVISIDRKHKKIKLTSIMRDMQTEIPGKGPRKFNAAFVLGGPELTINTANTVLGLDIQKYIMVDIAGVEKIVDKLGGVTVTVYEYEMDLLNRSVALANSRLGGNIAPVAKAGKQTLNGRQAVAYMRIRKVGNGDYDRTRRQREVLSALFTKLKQKNLIEMMPVFDSILSILQTNMTKDEMIGFITDAFTLMDRDVMQFRVPIDGHYSVQGTDIIPKEPETNDLLHQFIYSDTPPPEVQAMMKSLYRPYVPSPSPSPSSSPSPTPSMTPTPTPSLAPSPSLSPSPSPSVEPSATAGG